MNNDIATWGKVAVLMGGDSAEREISLLSGAAVLAALQQSGVDAFAFDPAQTPLQQLQRENYARVFICLHGRGGEDGKVQGLLELLGLPYTGSGVMASAVAMDKWRTKLLWQACGLPTPAYVLLDADSNWDEIVTQIGLPLMVKPVHEGSSMGITKVTQVTQLPQAWEDACRYDRLVIAEQFIDGAELTVGFLEEEALPVVRIEAPGGRYDYQHKYFSEETRYYCPSELAPAQEQALQKLALRSASVLGCRGWGRVDLMINRQGEPYLIELNTSPGMTDHSLVPMAAQQIGVDFTQLCLCILAGARLD